MRNLPSSSSDGGEDDLDDAALLLLDHAGEHREPEAEDADEDQHGADVREQETRLIRVGLRIERVHLGWLLRRKQRGRVDLRIGDEVLEPECHDRGGHRLRQGLVRLLGEPDRPG